MKKFSSFLFLFLFVFLFSSNVFGVEVGEIFDTPLISWKDCPQVEEPFGRSEWNWFRDVIPAILEGKMDLNVVDSLGNSALHMLCGSVSRLNAYGNRDAIGLVESLLNLGANPNILDESGCTPLLRLVSRSNCDGLSDWMVDLIDLLINRGASCVVENVMGENVLHGAVRVGDLKVLECLLKNIKNNDWRCFFACEKCNDMTPLCLALDRLMINFKCMTFHQYVAKEASQRLSCEGWIFFWGIPNCCSIVDVLVSKERALGLMESGSETCWARVSEQARMYFNYYS